MTTTLAQVEAALAARFEGLRRPCESHNSEGAYISGRHIYKQSVDCPDCSGLLYVPNCSMDTLLDALPSECMVGMNRVGDDYGHFILWQVKIRDGNRKQTFEAEGATPREALARALWAAEKEGAKHA